MSDQPKSNCPRSRDDIAGEIHQLERKNIFTVGALLVEARDGPEGEHGEWMRWLEQFDFSYDTAYRYMDAHGLALKFCTVRTLRVPTTIIYNLAEEGYIETDDDLEVIIKALDEAAAVTERPLSVADCRRIITEAYWKAGPLPDWLNAETLHYMCRCVHTGELRRLLLEKLNAVKSPPLTLKRVSNLASKLASKLAGEQEVDDDGAGEQDADDDGDVADEQGDSEPPPTPPKILKQPPRSSESDIPPQPAASATANTDQKHAEKVEAQRNDIGPGSKAEFERLNTSNAELAGKLTVSEQQKDVAYERISELEKALAEKQRGSVDSLVEALVSALKKVSREKAEVTLEVLCKKLGIDPKNLRVEEEAAV